MVGAPYLGTMSGFRSHSFLNGIIALLGAIASHAVRRSVRGDAPPRDAPHIAASVVRTEARTRRATIDISVANSEELVLTVWKIRMLSPRGTTIVPHSGNELPIAVEPGAVTSLKIVVRLMPDTNRSDLGHGRLLVEYSWPDRPEAVVTMPVAISAGGPDFWQA